MRSSRWMGMRSCTWLLAMAAALVLVMSAAAQEAPTQATPGPAAETPQADTAGAAKKPADASPDTNVRLGAGDQLEIGVYNVPELTTKARVSDGGDIYLPLIDYVHVGGLTAEEAQEAIEKRLADGGYVKSPHVTLFVDQYASQNASLLGEVAKPGVYPVVGHQRLFDLISAGGGLTDKAGKSATITHRAQPDQPLTIALSRNLNDAPESNVDIYPGDTVIVRKADIVYVVGDVAHPSGILIDRGSLSVLQAIALAGGTTRTSKPGAARIIHKNGQGLSETPVPLKKILEAKAPDIAMNPDDILFIPSSAIKLALQDNAGIAMQAASLSLVGVR